MSKEEVASAWLRFTNQRQHFAQQRDEWLRSKDRFSQAFSEATTTIGEPCKGIVTDDSRTFELPAGVGRLGYFPKDDGRVVVASQIPVKNDNSPYTSMYDGVEPANLTVDVIQSHIAELINQCVNLQDS